MKASHRHHPTDERLIAMYFGDEGAIAEERKAVRQHLHGCEACTWRYTELTAPLQRLREDAASEADEVFTASRLEEQRDAIRRRLEDGSRAARVVPFPSARPATRPMHRPLVRWVAAAAAAGLIVGVSAGRLLDLRGVRQPVAAPIASASGAGASRPASTVTDSPRIIEAAVDWDMFSEIDLAARRLHSAELGALDALTPHPRDAVVAMR